MKDLDAKSRIINILSLSKSTPVIQRCINALEGISATIDTSSDHPFNTKEVLHIYRLRVQMYRDLNIGVIEGGDDLVNALEKEPSEQVRINGVRTKKEEFLVFTDTELKRLIGCVSVQASDEGRR